MGATEGVSAATRHGIGVTRMPAGSVAVVVAPTTLDAARADVERLRRSRAAVLVPDRPTAADLAAARTLGHAGIPLLTSGCPSSTLLHHTSRAQWCGASVALAAAGVPVTPVVVSNGPVDALDLVVARRDGTRILIAARARPARAQGTRTGGPTGGVWLLRRGPGDSAARLATDLGRADDQAGRAGLRLGAVTEARPAREGRPRRPRAPPGSGGAGGPGPAAGADPAARVRDRLPRLNGDGRPDHVALTFDDGPDPASTPAFLDLLDELGVRATFFVLGSMVERAPALARELAGRGHEVGVHGWDHRSLALRGPSRPGGRSPARWPPSGEGSASTRSGGGRRTAC